MKRREVVATADWVESYSDMAELTYDADAIAVGKVVDIKPSYRKHGVIFTDAIFQVEQYLKQPSGNPPSHLTLWQTGGRVNKETLVLEQAPLVNKGERYILFLRQVERLAKYRILGGYAGRFQVVDQEVAPLIKDNVTKDVAGLTEEAFLSKVKRLLS